MRKAHGTRNRAAWLAPLAKRPYSLFGVNIDTEWRSDFKWDRLVHAIDSLEDRRVLDVGCGSGYHCWRMKGAGAAEVIGIDPTPLFVLQFKAIQRYLNIDTVHVLPLALEQLPPKLKAFDTTFSMGVLYHRRSPIDHLTDLRDTLVSGGQLVLETLVVEGDEDTVFVPPDRYARMGNVWFLPSPAALMKWMSKAGFVDVTLVDVNQTTVAEQRSTDWMTFYSLQTFSTALIKTGLSKVIRRPCVPSSPLAYRSLSPLMMRLTSYWASVGNLQFCPSPRLH